MKNTIRKIEQEIQGSTSIDQNKKSELLDLIGNLNEEVAKLSKDDEEHAKSIAGFTQVSTHEAIRSKKDDNLLEISLKGLESTVEGFEATHPKLTGIVNSICMMLSNIGI